MSLKLTFLAFKNSGKNSGTSCPNRWEREGRGGGVEGGRGNLDKIQKNIYFFRETFPKIKKHKLVYLQK